MAFRILLALIMTVLCSFVVRGSLTTIPVSSGHNSTLESYLCNGSLPLSSDTTLLLEAGEHVIPAGPFCLLNNLSNITITGAGSDRTIVRCADGGRGFRFSFIEHLSISNLTLTGCGMYSSLIENITASPIVVLFVDTSSFVSLQRVTITLFFGLGVFEYSSDNVTLSEVQFLNCADGACSGAMLHVRALPQAIAVQSCRFENLSDATTYGQATLGAALVLWSDEQWGDVVVLVDGCLFKNVSLYFGGLLIYQTSVAITSTYFEYVSVGGALFAYNSSFLIIKQSVFIRNSAATVIGPGGAIYAYASNVYTSDSNFTGNTAIEGAAIFALRSLVDIANATFSNNRAISGSAVSGRFSNVYVKGSVFEGNEAATSGGAINAHSSKLNFTDCLFSGNSIQGGIMACIDGSNAYDSCMGTQTWRKYRSSQFYKSFSNSSYYEVGIDVGGAIYADRSFLYIIASNFTNNFAPRGGAISISCSLDMSIVGSEFKRNIALDWGGAVSVYNPPYQPFLSNVWNILLSNTLFSENSARIGGALFIFHLPSQSTVAITKSSFLNNSAAIGAAIYAGEFRNSLNFNTYTLNLSTVVVQDNTCWTCILGSELTGGAIYFSELNTVHIYGDSVTGSRLEGNSPEGAIQGLGGELDLYGMLLFKNNVGQNGGAIGLVNNAHLFFSQGSNISFHNNTATTFGGAIYIQGDPNVPKSQLIECAIRFGDQKNISIVFKENRANVAGMSIYATPIYQCTVDVNTRAEIISDFPVFYDATLDLDLTNDTKIAEVLSFPVTIYLCECDANTKCDLSNGYKISTIPGGTVRFNATSLDSKNRTSPTVIYATVPLNSFNISVGPQQNVQWIGKECETLEYKIHGRESVSFNLQLSTYFGAIPTVIQVTIGSCKPGFVLAPNSLGLLQCSCSDFLTKKGVNCNISSGHVIRHGSEWIGVHQDENINCSAFVRTCPLDYCNLSISQYSLDNTDQLCNGNRKGFLCGRCLSNMSVIFGSTKCRACSDTWFLTILLYALLGIALVALLLITNVTVSQGTVYGIIFYSNVLQINSSLLFSQSYLLPLRIVISLINLDLGFPLCFYNGMDDLVKTGLQFVFPAYVLLLTVTFITICHFCLRQSDKSLSHCNRLSGFIGNRAVSVLATLIYLSYSKLLRTVIHIFKYSTITLEGTADIRVWFYDGTVTYLGEKHLPFFLIAIAVSIGFLFPYTLALTFIPIIDRFSDHNRLFRWLNLKVNKIKPIIDAYYVPFKWVWRCWLGVRLWVLFVLYILSAFYSSDDPSLLFYTHAVILGIFLFLQLQIKPFGEKQKGYSKQRRRLNTEFYNWTDSFYIMNYIILSFTASYLLLVYKSSSVPPFGVAVWILVGSAVAIFVPSFIYRVVVAVKYVCKSTGSVENENNAQLTSMLSSDEMLVAIELDRTHRFVAPTTTYVAPNCTAVAVLNQS